MAICVSCFQHVVLDVTAVDVRGLYPRVAKQELVAPDGERICPADVHSGAIMICSSSGGRILIIGSPSVADLEAKRVIGDTHIAAPQRTSKCIVILSSLYDDSPDRGSIASVVVSIMNLIAVVVSGYTIQDGDTVVLDPDPAASAADVDRRKRVDLGAVRHGDGIIRDRHLAAPVHVNGQGGGVGASLAPMI